MIPPDNDGVERKVLHTRSITITGHHRSDGLFEIEGRLKDTKPYDFQLLSTDDVVAADDPIHQMEVCIVYDEGMTVRDVSAVAQATPYVGCEKGPATLRSLIGLNMGRGWSAAIRERLSGAAGCVHLTGLLVPMAATAYQAMAQLRQEKARERGSVKPSLDSCLAYSRHGELVRQRYPAFYIAPAEGE